MKHGPVATIRFRPLGDGMPSRPGSRYARPAKLPSDPPGSPFGTWTLCAELWSPPDEHGITRAWVQFLSPDAPADALHVGQHLVLYDGTRPAADVHVILARVTLDEPTDTDFLADEHAVPRRVA